MGLRANFEGFSELSMYLKPKKIIFCYIESLILLFENNCIKPNQKTESEKV